MFTSLPTSIFKSTVEQPRIRLDWQAYFRAFCEKHGEPVVYQQRLLFHDGWQYSMTNHGGPEWPPPDDTLELRSLQIAYWTQRRKALFAERHRLANWIQNLKDLQACKNVPLQQASFHRDENGWLRRSDSRNLDTDHLVERIEDMTHYIAECDKTLGELRDGNTTA